MQEHAYVSHFQRLPDLRMSACIVFERYHATIRTYRALCHTKHAVLTPGLKITDVFCQRFGQQEGKRGEGERDVHADAR